VRFVEFRDGTMLRLPVVEQPWKVTLISSNGQIKTTTLLPSQVQNLALTSGHEFEKKRQLLSYVMQLGSDDFPEREDAWHKLIKMGPSICPDLKACIPLTTDVEIQTRLNSLIAKLYDGNPKNLKPQVVFDRFDAKSFFWGFLEEPLIVVVNGKQFALSRKEVAKVSADLSGNRVAVERIIEKELPPDCVEEDFENNPMTKEPLKHGDNVEKLFVGKGFALSTSIKGSFVHASNFTVGGKSRGLSVANHEPEWHGEVTIRFCQPGKEHIPAVVDYFGCYLAYVQPGGTSLIAYDLQDREMGKLVTQQTGTEFLAFHANIPIHKIKFVPDPLHPMYTLDDFIFHFAPTVQAAHPDKMLVELVAGDSILCKEVKFKNNQVELLGLTAGLPPLTVALSEVARMNPAQLPKVQKHDGLFAEMSDGSILFAVEPADKRKMPVFARYPKLLDERKDIIGLWTTKSGRKLFLPKAGTVALLDSESQQWHEVNYLRFLEELVLWKKSDGKFAASGYPQFTTLWFAAPRTDPEPGSWHVQTVAGEDLVMTKGNPPNGQLSDGVTFNWRGQPMTIPATQIMSIYQVPVKK
jgi:hypothetical protein